MWIVYGIGSALFAGVTAILAKCGVRKTDSHVATALRTVVVLAFSWAIVWASGAQSGLQKIDTRTWVFLIVSGMSTGASWLCYFRALQLGNVNQVAAVDKSSVILTMVLVCLFLKEPVSAAKVAGLLLIAGGTYLMIQKKAVCAKTPAGQGWFFFAALSALFASLTAIFGKIGIVGVDSNLGSAIRTGVVLVMAWGMVLVTHKGREVRRTAKRELRFICLSGVSTGASWLFFYKALQAGPASVVVPIDKLSILVTVLFSRVVLHEHLTAKAGVGLALLTAGTLALLI